MRTFITHGSVSLLLALVAGCASISPSDKQPYNPDTAPIPPLADACVGVVQTPPEGLIEASDPDLLQMAIGKPNDGKLCKGKVFVAAKPVTVYRVWDGAKSYTALGSWWSLSTPSGTRDKYRVENDICPTWSALDRMSSCTLKVGAKIVIGPGQSAQCDQTVLPPSAVNQVFIPNDTRNDKVYVDNCSDGVNWPVTAAVTQ